MSEGAKWHVPALAKLSPVRCDRLINQFHFARCYLPHRFSSATNRMPPSVAIIAAGAMGAALGARLVSIGHCTVYTVLAERSLATVERARKAGLVDIPLSELPLRAEWVLSVLPPSEADSFAKSFLATRSESSIAGTGRSTSTRVFVDCNAVSPATAKAISTLFSGSGISFIDAGIDRKSVV